MNVGVKIISFFLNSKKVSCLRTYIAIKILFNGNMQVTPANISKICNSLNTSHDNIKKHLSQLIALKMLENGGNNYVHVFGNKRFGEREFELINRVYSFDLSDLIDIKRFRTLCHCIEFSCAAETYKNETCVNKEAKNAGYNKTQLRYVLSLSWLSNTVKRSKSTVAKYRLSGKNYQFISYKRNFEVISHTPVFRKRFFEQKQYIKTNMCFGEANVIDHNKSNEMVCLMKELKNTESGLILLFDNKNNVAALVKEVAPEVKFCIKTSKRKNRLRPEEAILFKRKYDMISSVKN